MMPRAVASTSYARLSPAQAWAVLAAFLLLAVVAVAVTFSPLAQSNAGKRRPGGDDVRLYCAEVQRIRAGEGYYPAAAAELTARGYPTRSVFNWRTPLPMWLLGQFPPGLDKTLLGGLTLLLVLLAFEAVARDGAKAACGLAFSGDGSQSDAPRPAASGTQAVGRAVFCVLLLSGPLLFCVLGDLCVMPVLWSGVFIALSLCAYGVGRHYLGATFGLAAAFFRELALPYCLLSAGLAWWQGRRRELAWWLAGLALWAGWFALHWMQVNNFIPSDARAHPHGWIRFGGLGFLLSTVQMNAYLMLLPQWVTALYMVAALVGLAGWNTPLGLRFGLTVCLFASAFAAVGQEFNQYWGSITAPLWCFGVARLPVSLRDLFRAALRTSPGIGGVRG